MKKVAEVIADFLCRKGIQDVFTITGGGAMHLNDAIGHHPGLRCTYNHHEQACAIAAEGYARLTGRIAAVCVTSGPGGVNALTGVLGGWQDSIPMLVISGQVKRETTTVCTKSDVRQLGDQEFQITDAVRTMTKYAVMVTVPEEILYHLEKAYMLATTGRMGPVWLDIPLDVQAARVDENELTHFISPISDSTASEEKVITEKNKYPEAKIKSFVTRDESSSWQNDHPKLNQKDVTAIKEALRKAKKPAILIGTGVRLAKACNELRKLAEYLKIPVITAWNAHDAIEDDFSYYCGRPGTVGTRGGNYIVCNCDLLLVFGCRLNIRMISYNYQDFASQAYKIVIDIDKRELCKPTIKPDLGVHADLRDVIQALRDDELCQPISMNPKWFSWCKEINARYPAYTQTSGQERTLDQYAFTDRLSDFLTGDDVVVCGNGGACVVTFQALRIKKGMRLFTNSGCAAMGYGFPAAIGCAQAKVGTGKRRVICIDGDGSFQMNLQELQTVIYNRLELKIIIINNNGYHSIRQTQKNLFDGKFVGIDSRSGISFPNLERLSYAYGLPYYRIASMIDMDGRLFEFLNEEGPSVMEVFVDEKKFFEPKLSSRVLEDGTMVSPRLDDMYPFLDRDEQESNRFTDEIG